MEHKGEARPRDYRVRPTSLTGGVGQGPELKVHKKTHHTIVMDVDSESEVSISDKPWLDGIIFVVCVIPPSIKSSRELAPVDGHFLYR